MDDPRFRFRYATYGFDKTQLRLKGDEEYLDARNFPDDVQSYRPHDNRFALMAWVLPPIVEYSRLWLLAFGETREDCLAKRESCAGYMLEFCGAVFPMDAVPLYEWFCWPPDAARQFATMPHANAARWQETMASAQGAIPKEEVTDYKSSAQQVSINAIPPCPAAGLFRRFVFQQITPPNASQPLLKIRGIFASSADAVAFCYGLRKRDADAALVGRGLLLSQYCGDIGLLEEFPVMEGKIQKRVRLTESKLEAKAREKRMRKLREEIEEAKELGLQVDVEAALAQQKSKKMMERARAIYERGDVRAELEMLEEVYSRSCAESSATSDAPFERWKIETEARLAHLRDLLARGILFEAPKPEVEQKESSPKEGQEPDVDGVVGVEAGGDQQTEEEKPKQKREKAGKHGRKHASVAEMRRSARLIDRKKPEKKKPKSEFDAVFEKAAHFKVIDPRKRALEFKAGLRTSQGARAELRRKLTEDITRRRVEEQTMRDKQARDELVQKSVPDPK